MKTRTLIAALCLAALSLLLSVTSGVAQPPPLTDADAALTGPTEAVHPDEVRLAANTPYLQGGLIHIAYLTLNQNNPAVAYATSSGQYLAVFESSDHDGDIIGRYVDAETGQVVGDRFYITDTAAKEHSPDVAYDSYRNRFLVVWQEYTCGASIPQYCYYTIRGRLLRDSYNGGNMLAGDRFEVASEWTNMAAGYDLRDPAVAFNAREYYFQVVYVRGQDFANQYRQIYGRLLRSDASQPVPLGDRGGFEIRTYTSGGVRTPDVAWSEADAFTFLAAWERWRDTDVDYITVAYLYDWYRAGAPQVQGRRWIAPLNSGTYPLTRDCANPAIAYDPVNDAFTVVFEHSETPFTGIDGIYGQRVTSQYSDDSISVGGYAFPIETTIDDTNQTHGQPDIAYSSTTGEMHVVYHTEDSDQIGTPNYRVYDRTVSGAQVSARLQVRGGSENWLQDSAVACADGCCLVAWREMDTVDDWDIFGQRVCSAVNAPTIETVNPSCGRSDAGEKVTFTTYFEDLDGADDIKLVYFIVNQPVSYVNGVGMAYNLELNKMVMRNDSHTGWIVGWAPGTGGNLETSRATLHVGESSATKNGNRLTVTWVVTFKQPMSPRPLNQHMVVVDFAHNHSSWQTVGSWGVGTTGSPPCPESVTPSSGTSDVGDLYTPETFIAELDGWTDLKIVYLLISPTPGWNNQAIYLAYNQDVNKIFLRNNTNSGWLGGYAPGSGYTIQNNNVTVDVANCSVTGSGPGMWVDWALRPRTGFTGMKYIYVSAVDSTNYYAWWRKLGTWQINP